MLKDKGEWRLFTVLAAIILFETIAMVILLSIVKNL